MKRMFSLREGGEECTLWQPANLPCNQHKDGLINESRQYETRKPIPLDMNNSGPEAL